MGIFGAGIGTLLGNELGSMAGTALGGLAGKKGRRIGGKVGGAVGIIGGTLTGASLIPIKTGGKVMAPKNKPVPALIHGGEYILPVNAKPTKAQKAIVAKNKLDARKKK
jgi:hypothetical protein